MRLSGLLLSALLLWETSLALEMPPQLLFEVRRDGEPVGSHCLRFSRSDEKLLVEAAMDLKVPLPLWFDYRYRYRASEQWRDGRLWALEVSIEDGGEPRRIEARRQGDALMVESSRGQQRLPGDLLTSNHWNPAVVDKRELLNTLTGQASRLQVQHLGWERVPFGAATLKVQRYRLGGDLKNTEVWYDDAGLWRGLAFNARDGSRIRLHPLNPDAVARLDPTTAPWSRNPICHPGRQSG